MGYREEFIWQEGGLFGVVIISRELRKEGTQFEGVEEQLAGYCPMSGKPRYFRVHWFTKPIPGSRGRVSVEEIRTITEDEYAASLRRAVSSRPRP